MKNPQETNLLMKILSNPKRFAIMDTLFRTKKDLCVSEIAEIVGISQSLASHQLAYLETRGIISGHRMGQTICYTPTNIHLSKKIKQIIELLN